MFLILFLCFSALVMVSANTVIPVQTYPFYQQNGYINPIANQPQNIQPYNYDATVQNQLQQLNISPSSVKQALLNRLLTGTSGQAIIDPNTRRYGTNLDISNNNQIVGNGANNYVMVPVEYLNNNINNTNTEETPRKETSKKKRKSKSKRRQNEDENIEDNEKTSNKSKSSSSRRPKNDDSTTENNKTTKKKKRKHNTQVSQPESDTKNIDNNKNSGTKRRKKKEKEHTTEKPNDDANSSSNKKSRKRRRKQKVNETVDKSETDNKVNKKSNPKEIKENVDLDITNEGMNNENRNTRNSKHDIKEMQKAIPGKPKQMTQHFLSNVNQFNNPLMKNWFSDYENLYQSVLTNQKTNTVTTTKKRKPSKKNTKNNKRNNQQNRNSTIVIKNKNNNTVAIDKTTTEKAIYVTERAQVNFNSNPVVENLKPIEREDKNMKYTSNEIFRDGYSINDFEERYDTNYYEGYIDDYYPLFSDSAAYTANNKEIILKNLNDNKYYYATDRTDTDTKILQKPNQNFTEYALNDYKKLKHTYEKIEKEIQKNVSKKDFVEKIDENIQFRSPPHLEVPDFRTRQIDKSEIRPQIFYTPDDSLDRYVGDKSSSYSSTKNQYNTGNKPNKIKMQPKDIETVYAKSKVVAYGPVYIPEDHATAESIDRAWFDDSFASNSFQSAGTTYVVAESLDSQEI